MIELIKDAWRDGIAGKAILLGGFLMACLFIIPVVDLATSKVQAFEAEVIDREYKPNDLHTSTGFMLDGGKLQPIVTTTGGAEQWVVVCRVRDTVLSVNTSPERWASVKPGEKAIVNIRLGGFVGMDFSKELQ